MKSIFWHEVRDFLGGDASAVAAKLKGAGFEMVCVKGADGPAEFGSPQAAWTPDKLPNIRQDLVDALHAQGLQVWGWGFNYAVDPVGEANIAVALVNRFGLDGWACDWESAAEVKGAAAASAFVSTLRRGLPQTRLAAAVWAEFMAPKSGTQWHPVDVYKALVAGVDEVWPMMYWEVMAGSDGVQGALWLLGESTRQWRTITDKPIVPVGRAYVGDNGRPTSLAITAFAKAVRAGGYPGISWWELSRAFAYPDVTVWNALAASPNWGASFIPPMVVPGDALARLWAYAIKQGWTL